MWLLCDWNVMWPWCNWIVMWLSCDCNVMWLWCNGIFMLLSYDCIFMWLSCDRIVMWLSCNGSIVWLNCHVMWLSDVFIPCLGSLLVNLRESKEVCLLLMIFEAWSHPSSHILSQLIKTLLEELPRMFANNRSQKCALGSALQVAEKLLVSVQRGFWCERLLHVASS